MATSASPAHGPGPSTALARSRVRAIPASPWHQVPVIGEAAAPRAGPGPGPPARARRGGGAPPPAGAPGPGRGGGGRGGPAATLAADAQVGPRPRARVQPRPLVGEGTFGPGAEAPLAGGCG